MIIGLASPRIATSLDDGLANVERLTAEAAARGAEIVCFPEAYLPGLRGLDFDVSEFSPADEERTLQTLSRVARTDGIAIVAGMEHITDVGHHIAAAVFDRTGTLHGIHTKNQLDPAEERFYVPGTGRRVFEINGVKFGIAICHEGFRYPETVRWAATNGAKIVFHPHLTGSDKEGIRLTHWLSADAPYYEKAVMCRALENTIFVASVNYAQRFQESATAVIGPTGACEGFLPYGQDGVLVQNIDVSLATGLLASRYAPERYHDSITD